MILWGNSGIINEAMVLSLAPDHPSISGISFCLPYGNLPLLALKMLLPGFRPGRLWE